MFIMVWAFIRSLPTSSHCEPFRWRRRAVPLLYWRRSYQWQGRPLTKPIQTPGPAIGAEATSKRSTNLHSQLSGIPNPKACLHVASNPDWIRTESSFWGVHTWCAFAEANSNAHYSIHLRWWIESGLALSTVKRAKWLILLGPSKGQERCLTYGETNACKDSWKALFEIRTFSKESSQLSRVWATKERGYNVGSKWRT